VIYDLFSPSSKSVEGWNEIFYVSDRYQQIDFHYMPTHCLCIFFFYVRHLFYGEWILNIEKWRLEVKGSCFYLVLFLKPHEKNRAKSTASFVSVYLLF
jgi:hypothetical protein